MFAQGIAFPTVAARQGARAHDRHRDAHARRAAVRARRVRRASARGAGDRLTWRSRCAMAKASAKTADRSRGRRRRAGASDAHRARVGVLRDLHARPARRRLPARVHARDAGGLAVLRQGDQGRGAGAAAVAHPRGRVHAPRVSRLHAAPVAGAPRHLRHRAADGADRAAQAVHRRQADADPDRARRLPHRRAGAGLARRRDVARRRLPRVEPADPAGGGRSAHAQEGPRSGTRDSAGDAAARDLRGDRDRGVRRDAPRQHGRRRSV